MSLYKLQPAILHLTKGCDQQVASLAFTVVQADVATANDRSRGSQAAQSRSAVCHVLDLVERQLKGLVMSNQACVPIAAVSGSL